MPINENTSKTSIEFTYENMEKSVFQNIRYSYTEHHGPTITLLSEDGSDLYSAPAEMFIDVVRFLYSKNAAPAMASINKIDDINDILPPIEYDLGLNSNTISWLPAGITIDRRM